jgi:hypothetical protein
VGRGGHGRRSPDCPALSRNHRAVVIGLGDDTDSDDDLDPLDPSNDDAAFIFLGRELRL